MILLSFSIYYKMLEQKDEIVNEEEEEMESTKDFVM